MENEFLKDLKGRIVIVGVGNPLRGDDGAGPALIRELRTRIPEDHPGIALIDAGEAPENYLMSISEKNPGTILLFDAADMKKPPGSVNIIAADEIREVGLSTHNASLRMIVAFLQTETDARIFLVGIQPEQVQLGEPLSEIVSHKIKILADLLIKRLNHA
jgi:hydrogenase 3 maturation protease